MINPDDAALVSESTIVATKAAHENLLGFLIKLIAYAEEITTLRCTLLVMTTLMLNDAFRYKKIAGHKARLNSITKKLSWN